MNTVVYLYGFVPAASAPPPSPPVLDGMAGAAVRLLHAGDIAAVVSDVPAHEFTAAHIEERLDDLDWAARQGLTHERVVAWFVDHGDIVPAPLFTMYSSAAVLESDIEARRASLHGHLARLAGQREWDLKVAYDVARLSAGLGSVSDEIRALDTEMAAAAPGRRFLLERKRKDLARGEARRVAVERAGALFDALASHATRSVRLTIPRTTDSLPVLLHAALLVPRTADERLAAELAAAMNDLEPLGFAASLTGPWAPYRFLGDDA